MIDRLELKYGCNPNQRDASIEIEGKLPIHVLNGKAGYINLLDALNGYQLARELREATGLPAAASFKHVSPAGAAVAVPLSREERAMYFISRDAELSPIAAAYARARGADRMSSFGDFIALSEACDRSAAEIISKEVSDGIIAPGYDDEAEEILRRKKNGTYTIIEIDPSFTPPEEERKTVYGVTFRQMHNSFIPSDKDFRNPVTRIKEIPEEARRDLIIAMLTAKYTQSNSVCYAANGQSIGVGAGQQSRIHCTRLAGDKADHWSLRHSDKVLSLPFRKGLSRNEKDNAIEQYLSDIPEIDLFSSWENWFTEKPEPFTAEEKAGFLSKADGIALASDAFFPFRDNIDRAARSGVRYIAEPGGSMRDDAVINAADEHNMAMFFTGVRLFHH